MGSYNESVIFITMNYFILSLFCVITSLSVGLVQPVPQIQNPSDINSLTHSENYWENNKKALKENLKPIITTIFSFGKIGLLLFFLGIIALFVVHNIQKRNDKMNFLSTTRLSSMDPTLKKACLYIERKSIKPHFSSEGLCEDLSVSTVFLNALFEDHLGMSLEEFIMHVRINRSILELQQDSDVSSQELSQRCGYETEQQFLVEFYSVVAVNFREYKELSSVETIKTNP